MSIFQKSIFRRVGCLNGYSFIVVSLPSRIAHSPYTYTYGSFSDKAHINMNNKYVYLSYPENEKASLQMNDS